MKADLAPQLKSSVRVMNTVFPPGPPSLFDKVRIRSSVETESKAVAGLEGQVYGQTTPSQTGVEVIGEITSDYAINVYFKDRDESFWFAASLVEFIGHAPVTKVTLDGVPKKWIRTATGEWREESTETTSTKPWWRFWN